MSSFPFPAHAQPMPVPCSRNDMHRQIEKRMTIMTQQNIYLLLLACSHNFHLFDIDNAQWLPEKRIFLVRFTHSTSACQICSNIFKVTSILCKISSKTLSDWSNAGQSWSATETQLLPKPAPFWNFISRTFDRGSRSAF